MSAKRLTSPAKLCRPSRGFRTAQLEVLRTTWGASLRLEGHLPSQWHLAMFLNDFTPTELIGIACHIASPAESYRGNKYQHQQCAGWFGDDG